MLGNEYFRLEPNEKRALAVEPKNFVFEQLQENITITSDQQLKEQNKIIEEYKKKNIEVTIEKEQVEKELGKLKEIQSNKDQEIAQLNHRLKTYTNQQTKIDEQNTLIESKNRENLTHKAKSLQSENIRLKDFNDKSLGLLIEIASTNPELRSKFIKDDAWMEMG